MSFLEEKLGLSILETASVSNQDIEVFENKHTIELPSSLKELLHKFQGAIVFDKGAKFKSECSSGREDDDGYLSLEMLYGGHLKGDNSLEEVNARLSDELGSDLVVVGDSTGGDQICINRKNGTVIFWMHDTPPLNAEVLISKSFDDFIESLEPDECENDSGREVIESESFLDF